MKRLALIISSLVILPIFGCIFDSSGGLIIESSERGNPYSANSNKTGGFSITIKNYADSSKHLELNITLTDKINLYLESPGIAEGPTDIAEVYFTEIDIAGDDHIYNIKPKDANYTLDSGEDFTIYFTVQTTDPLQDTAKLELYADGKLADEKGFDFKVDTI